MVNTTVTTSTGETTEVASVPQAPSMTARALLWGIKLIGLIPISIRSAIGGGIGWLVGHLPLREGVIVRLQLQAFLPEASSKSVAPKVFANMGRSIMESLNLAPLLRPPFPNIVCTNWDTIIGWTRDSRPIVALTAHTGNWDLLAAYAIARGVPIATIGREARNPDLQLALRSMREAYGVDTIWRSDKGGIKQIVNCLRERRVLAALIDQDTRVESCFVPFLGTPAKTPSALIELGKRFNARFVSAFIVRSHGTQFEIHAAELDASATTEEILLEYHRRLESIIRSHPDQWVWVHKRWRSNPQGETLGSKDYIKMLSKKIGRSI